MPISDILRADSVGHRYGERRVLSSATLRAVGGEVRVLFGRNGTGKSTLLKIAAGVLRADTGVVFLHGEALLRPSLPRLARAGVFWLPDHEFFSQSFSIARQLAFIQQQFDGHDIGEAAAVCGVEHCMAQRPHQLSGGELRRAELAAVLVRRPMCLLADEPLRGVTPRDAEDLGHVFRLLASRGTAVVLTGHEAVVLGSFSDHVTWCTGGTTYELGAPAAAFAHPQFAAEYLGAALRRTT